MKNNSSLANLTYPIAIEISINIISYLRENVFHIKIVLATVFMAVARKVIVLDCEEVSSDYVFARRAGTGTSVVLHSVWNLCG